MDYLIDYYKEYRNIYYDDLRGNKLPIGMGAIRKFWGDFNSMMSDLGFDINQENMIS